MTHEDKCEVWKVIRNRAFYQCLKYEIITLGDYLAWDWQWISLYENWFDEMEDRYGRDSI